jgi:PPOX class probable F420-dependent enzyme
MRALGVAGLAAPTPTPHSDRSSSGAAAYHPAMHQATAAHDAATALPSSVREFLAATRFATIATIDPDGAPRQAVLWYRLEGDEIVLNSRVGRRWPSNLSRDPRIAVTVVDADDGYRWVGLTGTVQQITDQAIAQADIAEMARRYHADDPPEAERLIADGFRLQQRISFRVHVEAVHDHLDDD